MSARQGGPGLSLPSREKEITTVRHIVATVVALAVPAVARPRCRGRAPERGRLLGDQADVWQTLAPVDEVHVAVVRRLVSHKLDRRARRTSAVLFDDCASCTRRAAGHAAGIPEAMSQYELEVHAGVLSEARCPRTLLLAEPRVVRRGHDAEQHV